MGAGLVRGLPGRRGERKGTTSKHSIEAVPVAERGKEKALARSNLDNVDIVQMCPNQGRS